ncbi:MAG: RNA-binding protein [Acidobacteria bacterium]|nr:RNA-binding protein [Acidobacteriota bacterium]
MAAVRLFVGNMPYGATEADLRAHFAPVGDPSQVVIPVDRETGRPRGFAFVEYIDRAKAEEAVNRYNQQPFMGRSLSVSEARPREERPPGGFAPRPPGAGFTPRPPGAGGGFTGGGGGGGFRPSSGPPSPAGRNFGPPKRKGAGSEKRWDAKEKGPKGPLKERFSGRLGGLYDENEDGPSTLSDFDDPAATAKDDDE